MALFDWLSKEEIKEHYTHKGWVLFVPIYLVFDPTKDYDNPNNKMLMSERNGIPAGSIDVVDFIWRVFTYFFPVGIPTIITGRTDEL